MKVCACGCNEETIKGDFKQGHDQKLRTKIEKKVGGLLNLRNLVENTEDFLAGEISTNDLKNSLSIIFNNNDKE